MTIRDRQCLMDQGFSALAMVKLMLQIRKHDDRADAIVISEAPFSDQDG
ncbi:hypothetical protein HNQ59_002994 [Chitinivorax tropicus]|uniref:Uncharacterized protein n=1 Tax=Chitinivorax tropicus TaxID=714531 RepID=A0A840MTH8_9PROT|nr:hypothetical protein [Chitinivorax tropicus]